MTSLVTLQTLSNEEQFKGQRLVTWVECAKIFPDSVTYLKLMKPKGLGELGAATSDLANQTGIEKTHLLIIHKPNLTSSHFKKYINGPWKPEAQNQIMPVLVTSNFDDDSIKNEWASMETPFSHYKSMGKFLDLKSS